MPERILVIDDEREQRQLIERCLGDRYRCTLVANAAEARAELGTNEYELALCDVNMPGESGIGLIEHMHVAHPDTAVAMVTGVDDDRIARDAFNRGAYGYIVKPVRASELRIAVMNALRRRKLELTVRRYVEGLEGTLLERSAEIAHVVGELERSRADLEAARLETLQRLSLAVEARDRVTAAHVNDMVGMVERLALALGLEPGTARCYGVASAMHDLGKIGVPDAILLKPGALTADERLQMQRHSEIGYEILKDSPNLLLQLGASIARSHHERWDGTGYPDGLSGDAIPYAARIVQVVDVFSALKMDRPYRRAYSIERSRDMVLELRGSAFDPAIVDRFAQDFGDISTAGMEATDEGSNS